MRSGRSPTEPAARSNAEALRERPGESLLTAFQDWSNIKAAYHFFSNGNISEDKILEGHFAASALRIRATNGPILILQDTTEFSFKRSAPEKVASRKYRPDAS